MDARKPSEKPLTLAQIELRIKQVEYELRQPRCEFGALMRELADLRSLRAVKIGAKSL